jgi:porphobilinogen synthase
MSLLADPAATRSVSVDRGRRLRRTAAMRALVRETRLHPRMLVQPLFIRAGVDIREEIAAMPGQYRVSVDRLAGDVERVAASGVRAVILFGLPDAKDHQGSGAWDTGGVVQRGIRAIRQTVGDDVVVIADVCLCEYTSHGHCGVVTDVGGVDNDATLPLLARSAVSLAEAGADIVAPSAMMDGQVAAIRDALDAAGWHETAILAYAAKHASAFYGPFREAADSAPAFGDRRTYQMDPANGREALLEIDRDLDEGADIVMVKPAGPALDILAAARARVAVPLAAYQVSGEYASLVAAAQHGWLDGRAAALESLTAIARAGADVIITYFATQAAGWLREELVDTPDR